jgi:hypothetical protein
VPFLDSVPVSSLEFTGNFTIIIAHIPKMSSHEDRIFKDFEHLVSVPRFRRYRHATNSKQEAVALYLWNAALCEALYPPIHFFEVALRNATHQALSARQGTGKTHNPRWFMDTGLLTQSRHRKQVEDAITQVWSLKPQCVGNPADDNYPKEPQRIVAALSLGFWVNLYSAPYGTTIVQAIAGDVFPNGPKEVSQNKRQGKVYPPLADMLGLRNRIFHHEPIYHWTDRTVNPDKSLMSNYRRLREVISWMCTIQPLFLAEIDRFEEVHKQGVEHFMDAVQYALWHGEEQLKKAEDEGDS